MANRHLARSVAMQSLFEWDFRGENNSTIAKILDNNLKEFAPGFDDRKFVEELVEGVLKNRDKIDSIIEKAAPEWPLAQVAMVDRNVLRIGLYELLFGSRKEVPPKVAINEAIELAKTFGSESSGRFVNGVLGTVYREIGEPGKEETSKKKNAVENLDKLPIEIKTGGVVFRRDGKRLFFALVHDVFGYWTLSKGSPIENEEIKDAAIRKVKEELGILNAKIIDKLGITEYIAKDPERGQVRRQVSYFLIETDSTELNLEASGGLDDAKWFAPGDVQDLKTYPDIKPLLSKSLDIIKNE
ncbi:transcription antitermination factor NusB [Candidatus Giovannonibacteria bacterium]|nr:transcription antitermination factor NusB [Candidatus Giovannonibacteria bacterium]